MKLFPGCSLRGDKLVHSLTATRQEKAVSFTTCDQQWHLIFCNVFLGNLYSFLMACLSAFAPWVTVIVGACTLLNSKYPGSDIRQTQVLIDKTIILLVLEGF